MKKYPNYISIILTTAVLTFSGCSVAAPSQTKEETLLFSTEDEESAERKSISSEESFSQPETAPTLLEEILNTLEEVTQTEEVATEAVIETVEERNLSLFHVEGSTMETRIDTPEGYTRVPVEAGSFAEFLRTYPLKESGSPLLLYDGSVKPDQSHFAAIFQLPIENMDEQQCADSVMRMYAEYFWHTGQYERIAFTFVNGFSCPYTTWRDGYRVRFEGETATWVQSAGYDDSYECFKEYMHIIFAYCSTLSLDSYESTPIPLAEVQIGDVFLKGGSPGHVEMIVDMCVNESGERAFLIAQGRMPAQEFHIIKNDRHEDDPWYYENEITYPFETPEYTFDYECLKRMNY